MSKKAFTLSILFLITGFGTTVSAESAGSLNAGLVSNIWHYPVAVSEGNKTAIYGGVYNSSDAKITGTAIYYVDAVEIQKVSFISEPKSLTQIEASWIAKGGDHKVQIKMGSTTEPMGATFASMESGESWITAERHITKESIQEDAQKVITKAKELIDPIAEKLAGNLEQKADAMGSVLGASAGDTKGGLKENAKSLANTAFAKALEGAVYLVRHWPWTLLGLAILYFMFKPKRRKRSWW